MGASALGAADCSPGETDPAYIHPGCSKDIDPDAYPVWRTNDYCQAAWGDDCAFGDGWYCNDDLPVWGWDPNNDFDSAAIHCGCQACDYVSPHDPDECVYWDGSEWKCNDSMASHVAVSKEEAKLLRGIVSSFATLGTNVDRCIHKCEKHRDPLDPTHPNIAVCTQFCKNNCNRSNKESTRACKHPCSYVDC